MTRKAWFIVNLFIAGMLLLTACGTAPTAAPVEEEPPPAEPTAVQEAALTPVSVRLSWLVKGEYVHVYMARELGYFQEEGLDVKILEGSPAASPMQLVAAVGDEFAYDALDEVARARSEGMPVIMVSSFLQTNPQSISALAPTKNDGPQDLVGKQIVDVPGGTLALIWPAFMRSQGLEPTDAELLVVDFGVEETMFLGGEVELRSSYSTNDIPLVEVGMGRDINYWKIADFGFNMLAHGIVTSEQYLAENPEVVAGMVRAVQRGAAWTVENPVEAAQRMSALFPDVLPENVTIRQVEETIKLFHTPNTLDKACGWIAEEDAERTIALLYDNEGIETREPISAYYTNDHIDPGISCPTPEG
jgi:NitT/TauT family transport system substrate-binding protein